MSEVPKLQFGDESPRRDQYIDDELVDDAMSWMASAACRELETNIFFPHNAGGVEEAKVVCRRCDVRADCLEYALFNRIEHGIWGGAAERERRRMLRRRKGGGRQA